MSHSLSCAQARGRVGEGVAVRRTALAAEARKRFRSSHRPTLALPRRRERGRSSPMRCRQLPSQTSLKPARPPTRTRKPICPFSPPSKPCPKARFTLPISLPCRISPTGWPSSTSCWTSTKTVCLPPSAHQCACKRATSSALPTAKPIWRGLKPASRSWGNAASPCC